MTAVQHQYNPLTIYIANTFMQRLRGLLARRPLEATEALLITGCNNVHSMGMKYSLDIAFLATCGTVLKVARLNPGSAVRCKEAEAVLELFAGSARINGIETGVQLVQCACQSQDELVSIGERK